MWNMVWCEMCCDVECGVGVEQLWMWNGVMWTVADVEYIVL